VWLLITLVLISWLSSRDIVRKAFPFESFLTFGLVAVAVYVLFKLDELG
jgi:hypothetical protein